MTLTSKSSGQDRVPSCDNQVVSLLGISGHTLAEDTLLYRAVCAACDGSSGYIRL